MNLLHESCTLVVNASGQSRWTVSNPVAATLEPNDMCEITFSKEKGRCLHALKSFTIGETIFTEQSIASNTSGEHLNRVCYHCKRIGLKKACVQEGCRYLFFCSKDCLTECSEFVEICGPIIQNLFERHPNQKDFVLIALHVLYTRACKCMDASKIFQMEQRYDIVDHEMMVLANEVYEICSKKASNLLVSGVNPSYICGLFRAIKFNIQSLSIPGLPSTYFGCLLNIGSKINHSCNPNIRIVYGLFGGSITVSFVAVRPITPGDELCISYTTSLNLRVNDRNNLLNAFSFSCKCNRCYNDLRSPLDSNFPFAGTKRELSLFRHYCAVGNSLEKSSIKDISDLVKIIMRQIEVCSSNLPMETFKSPSLSLYDLSDVSAGILQRLKFLSQASTTENTIICNLIVLSCFIISSCWVCFGAEYSSERLNTLIYGLSAASKLNDITSCDLGEDVSLDFVINKMCDQARSIIQIEAKLLSRTDPNLGDIYGKMSNLCDSLNMRCR